MPVSAIARANFNNLSVAKPFVLNTENLPPNDKKKEAALYELRKRLIEFIVKFSGRKAIFEDEAFRKEMSISPKDTCGDAVADGMLGVFEKVGVGAETFGKEITVKSLLDKLLAEKSLYQKIDEGRPLYKKALPKENWPVWDIGGSKLSELADDLAKRIKDLNLADDYILFNRDWNMFTDYLTYHPVK